MSFSVGCFYELALLVVALFWNQFFHRPLFADFNWDLKASLVAVVAVIPPLAFFIWTLKTNILALSRHKELMERLLRPLMGNWSILQLALISICAGVSEEALFRGGIQGGLAERVGAGPALALASLAFGAVHLITWTYAIIATFIGVYLGLLWVWTGNLFAPMVTHALYDFLALVYLLKVYRFSP
jgi:membrane protease YdiL (CAAX protease family)